MLHLLAVCVGLLCAVLCAPLTRIVLCVLMRLCQLINLRAVVVASLHVYAATA